MQNHNINEAIKILCIGRTKFYQELNAGRIKAVKIGTRTLIPNYSIEEWVENLPAYPVKVSGGTENV